MLIRVKVHTRSKNSKLIKKTDESFEAFVKSEPIEGRANDELVSLIANYFGVALNRIKIVHGGRSHNKILEIYDDRFKRLA
ncbi:MAG: DUF167 domain-containing protein [Candidatus Kryptoniota bacterium]